MSQDEPRAEKGISRRGLLKSGAAAGVAAALSGASAAAVAASAAGPSRPEIVAGAAPGDEAPQLVFVNGRIHTMDAQQRVVSSVAIKNGKFTAVGPGAPANGPGTKVINLKGRMVVPGITENHIHVVSMANRPGYHTPLEYTRNIAEVQATLAARRPGVPDDAWITSMGGWHPNMWAEHRLPTLAELDAAVPDRPVFLYLGFTGPAATNSLGKAFLETAVAPLAGPVTVGADGSMTSGTQATRALYHLRVLQTWEDKIRSTKDAMAWAASVGVTSMLDEVLFPIPGPFQPNWVLSNLDGFRMYDSWLAVHAAGETIVRLQTNFLQNQNDPALPELHERLKNQFQFFGDDLFQTGAIGEWAAPIGAGAVWQEAQRIVGQAQWRNENAVSSVNQLNQVVTAYEAVNVEFGISHLRWMVHHVPFVTTDLLNRLQAIGGGVAMRGFTWFSGGPGPGGQPAGAPFRTILNHGIKASLQGDGVHISTLTPWPHMQYAVTGVNALGQLINAGEQISRQEALWLFTRENPWFLRWEDKVGSIEPGKLADLVVLNQDYHAVPENDIYKTRSLLTVVGGKVVHDSGVV